MPKILPLDVSMRAALRVTQLVEQLVEVPTTVSYSSLFQRTVEQHVDIPVPGGGGGPSSGLQGFLPRQRSTASPSRKRSSERIVEQFVDPVSRGSLPGSRPGQSSPSSHSPAGVGERADEPGEGVFRTFHQNKKSAKVTSHSGSELPPHPSSSTAAAQLEDSVEWVRLKDDKSGKPYYWNRRSFSTVWQPPPGVKVVWNASKNEEGAATSGTRKRVSPRMTSLLCLLSEELHRQPRAVYKYWVGGLPFCDHAATCSSSSSSFTADMNQKDRCGCMYKAGIAGYFAPRAVFPSLVGRPRVLRILAGSDLKYSCSGMCKAGFSGVSAPHAVCLRRTGKLDFGRWRLFFSGPLYLAVTCSSCLPEEYRFASFREMTSGMFPVFSALLGSTADTCSASV